jgi:phosphoglycolate phosphatase-like HAD superfamily hydrolase
MLFGIPTVYCDVDETLFLWKSKYGKLDDPRCITMEVFDAKYKVLPHFKHIDLIIKLKSQGYKIVIWSAGGEVWANEAVDKLGLRKFVDVVLAKPTLYIDDKMPEEFLHRHNRIYMDPDED